MTITMRGVREVKRAIERRPETPAWGDVGKTTLALAKSVERMQEAIKEIERYSYGKESLKKVNTLCRDAMLPEGEE